MSYLGIRGVASEPGGFDLWSFAHAVHHNVVTQFLNQTQQPKGNLTLGSVLIPVSTTFGVFPGMLVTGNGLPPNTFVTGVDSVAINITVSNAPTATVANDQLTIVFFPTLPTFILDPINTQDQKQFLLDHQNSHNAINAALGTLGNDLQDLDFNDEKQVRAWMDLDFTEHQSWSTITGISTP